MKQILEQIKKEKIVPIIRTSTKEKAIMAVDALVEAGFKNLEITFTIPHVEEVIQYAFEKYQDKVILGSGTVLTVDQAKIAQKLGCQFIVGPNLNEKVNDFCHQQNLLYIPGVMTVNEMVKALEMGNEMVKLFPTNAFSLDYVKSIKAPLPKIQIMATGGITDQNILNWFQAGIDVCGVGGNLIEPIEKNNDSAKVVKLGKEYLTKVKK